jgi:hypothetical protein
MMSVFSSLPSSSVPSCSNTPRFLTTEGPSIPSAPTTTDASYRDIALSSNEIERRDHTGDSKRIRRKKANDAKKLPKATGGNLQTLRGTDEETEAMLALAYSTEPKRTGPQNFNRKRRFVQKWRKVHIQHRVVKKQLIASHFKTMAKRKRIADEGKYWREKSLELYGDHSNNWRLRERNGEGSKEGEREQWLS